MMHLLISDMTYCYFNNENRAGLLPAPGSSYKNSDLYDMTHFFIFFFEKIIFIRKNPYICTPKSGEMPEWSIGPHSKCGVRATVPG
ncbi:MAG: hypothetical protein K2H81_03870, partial [Alistipes sp.]|nr:hypothetical protein [Alistipes sp.]